MKIKTIDICRDKRLKGRGHKREGFTLIEVLVVIGIIAILAAIVLVAVNPARQFKMARDSQRVSNVNALLNAIGQNISEHKGTFYCSGVPMAIPATSSPIRYMMYGQGSLDLAPCLVPDYISSLPFDPAISSAHYVSKNDYETGYYAVQNPEGSITISATGELTPSISVTR